jgi:LysR family transcriptional regulator for metE and metH
MIHLEVRHLLLVRAVAEEGSLTRAGTHLNLTQSALSHQLLDLEERLGTRLFHRVGKRMVLAPAGERILESARRVLDDLTRAEEDVRLLASERKGTIRLTVECYTCYHWLPPLMKRFMDRHPGVDVRIDVESTKRPAAALVEGTIDVAIVSSEMEDPRLRITPLFEDEMVVVLAPDHPLAEREFLTARELAGETLMTYAQLEDSTAYRRILRPAGFEPRRWMQVPLTEAMVELIRGGVGVAVMARWSVWPQIESGAVTAVPITRRGLTRHWKAAVLNRDSIPAYLDAFIEMVATQPERQRRVPLHVPARRRAS